MATKKSTRRPAPRGAAYTQGPKRIRRRKLNGAAAPRRRRRMNAAGIVSRDTLKTTAQLVIGGILGGVAVGLVPKEVKDPNVRGVIVLGSGLVLAKFVPKARFVGLGMAAGAGITMAMPLVQKSFPQLKTLNSTRRDLPAYQRREIAKAIYAGGVNNAETLNGGETLNAAEPWEASVW